MPKTLCFLLLWKSPVRQLRAREGRALKTRSFLTPRKPETIESQAHGVVFVDWKIPPGLARATVTHLRGVRCEKPQYLLMAASGCSWLLLGPPGDSWGLLGPPGALLGSPGLSWALLGSPGLSWAPFAHMSRVICTLGAIWPLLEAYVCSNTVILTFRPSPRTPQNRPGGLRGRNRPKWAHSVDRIEPLEEA